MKNYFTKGEKLLWGSSVILIALSYILFKGDSILTLIASAVGVTSLIFNAKGNPVGQTLTIESCFAVRMPKEMRLQAEKYEAELFKRIAEKSS